MVGPAGHAWADFVHEVDEIVMLFEGCRIEVSFAGNPPSAGRGDRDPGARATPPPQTPERAQTAGITATAWDHKRSDHRPRDGVCQPSVKTSCLAAQGFRIARLHPHEPQGCVLPVPQAGQGIAPLEGGVTAPATAPAFPARSPQDQAIEYLPH